MNQPEVKTNQPGEKQHQNGMVALARQLEQHHLQPAPQTTEPAPQPFPPVLWQGLGGGIFIGALLGLLFGIILYRGMLVVPGWEGLFSLGPFTFHFFWTMVGVALGLLVGGVGIILAANPSPEKSNLKYDNKKENSKMQQQLNGKKVAILVENGFEQVELTEPKQALEAAGAQTQIVSPVQGKVKGWQHTDWGDEFPVDVPLSQANPDHYDALLLPGGVMNPDKLRRNEQAQRFVRAFFEAGKPVAAICHGPWSLIDAGVVNGRELTSYHSIQTDLKNAGAAWVDQEVVVDNGLVTSRKPDDLPAFNRKMIEEFAEGRHAHMEASLQGEGMRWGQFGPNK